MFTYDFEIYDLYHKLSESQIERLYEMLEKDREEYKAGWFDRNDKSNEKPNTWKS